MASGKLSSPHLFPSKKKGGGGEKGEKKAIKFGGRRVPAAAAGREPGGVVGLRDGARGWPLRGALGGKAA